MSKGLSKAWHDAMRGDTCWSCSLKGIHPQPPVTNRCCNAGWCAVHYKGHMAIMAEKGWPHDARTY